MGNKGEYVKDNSGHKQKKLLDVVQKRGQVHLFKKAIRQSKGRSRPGKIFQ